MATVVRRFFWFASGVVAGVSAFLWTRNRVEEIRDSLTPSSVARRTWDTGARMARRVRTAVAVGAEVMRNGPETTSVVSTPTTVRRRHIASRPNRAHG